MKQVHRHLSWQYLESLHNEHKYSDQFQKFQHEVNTQQSGVYFTFSMFSRMAYLQARWQISVMSAPLNP
jgi:hypothetical protein